MSKLTGSEMLVLKFLARSIAVFENLPEDIRLEDRAEFKHAIYAARNIVLARSALRPQNTQGDDEEVLSPELPAEDGTGEWKQGHWRDEKAHGSDWVQLGLWKRT